MSTDVRVPTTGNAGEDAVLIEWNVAIGTTVAQGAVLALLETAKASLEVEAPVAGEVLQLLYEAGDEIPEHAVLAVIGDSGGKVDDGSGQPPVAEPPKPAEQPDPASAGSEYAARGDNAPAPTDARASLPRSGRISVSPRARAMAAERSIDLVGIAGSGPLGRIVIRDVSAAQSSATPATDAGSPIETAAPAPAGAPAAPLPAPRPASGELTAAAVTPVRGARRATAQRMQASLTQTAQLTLTRYADATALLAYSARLRSHCESRGLPKIGLNDILMFAAARAMTRHSDANSWFDWDGISQFEQVNLGFAVNTERALLVPVIRDAGRLSLAELAAAAKHLIGRARAGALTSQEMDQGTFTVSNLGGLGVHWFTPVLNPPQSAILGIGAAYRAHPDAPAMIPLSLTFDHRALDGAAAAAALADLANTIETVDLLSAF